MERKRFELILKRRVKFRYNWKVRKYKSGIYNATMQGTRDRLGRVVVG